MVYVNEVEAYSCVTDQHIGWAEWWQLAFLPLQDLGSSELAYDDRSGVFIHMHNFCGLSLEAVRVSALSIVQDVQ